MAYIDFNDEDAFYSKEERRARRKSRRDAMTYEEKLHLFMLRLSVFFIAVFGNYGAYSFAKFVEEHTGFPSVILGIVLYILICWGAFYAPMVSRGKLQDQIDRINYEHKQEIQRLHSSLERDSLIITPFAHANKLGTDEEKAFISAIISKYTETD